MNRYFYYQKNFSVVQIYHLYYFLILGMRKKLRMIHWPRQNRKFGYFARNSTKMVNRKQNAEFVAWYDFFA